MKVLLVGEYNRAHRFLKEGLEKLGHEATVIGLRDGFKKVAIDIPLQHNYSHGMAKKRAVFAYKFFNRHLHSESIKKQIKALLPKISGYDIVQYINECPFLCTPETEIELFNLFKANNNKLYLLSCGDDYISVKYAYEKRLRYSILTPYFENKLKEKNYSTLKYLTPEFKKLHAHIFDNVRGVISGDLDYSIPLKNHNKHLGLIPYPINTDIINYDPLQITDKIVIFHGINSKNYYKKGNDIFEQALAIVKEKYDSKIEILTVKDLPYKKYITSFDRAHILLDQVYSYDQGYNALEAMAKGKVVFTGAEKEWLSYFNVKEDTIAINSLPKPELIAKKLEWLITNPLKMKEISLNARRFVEEKHHYINRAKDYIDKWLS